MLKFVQATTTDVFNGIVMLPQFMPTAKKFDYQFNLRDFSKIVQNLLLFELRLYRNKPDKLYRLWLHECNRVFLDRLLFEEDVIKYREFVKQATKTFDINEEQMQVVPVIYTNFVSDCQGYEKAYLYLEEIDVLKKYLKISYLSIIIQTQQWI